MFKTHHLTELPPEQTGVSWWGDLAGAHRGAAEAQENQFIQQVLWNDGELQSMNSIHTAVFFSSRCSRLRCSTKEICIIRHPGKEIPKSCNVTLSVGETFCHFRLKKWLGWVMKMIFPQEMQRLDEQNQLSWIFFPTWFFMHLNSCKRFYRNRLLFSIDSYPVSCLSLQGQSLKVSKRHQYTSYPRTNSTLVAMSMTPLLNREHLHTQ